MLGPETSSSTTGARPDARPACAGWRPDARSEHGRSPREHVITFLYDQHYACNEFCKYYKNAENPDTVHPGRASDLLRVGQRHRHREISQAEFEAMPPTFERLAT
jgi:hypothetical protein